MTDRPTAIDKVALPPVELSHGDDLPTTCIDFALFALRVVDDSMAPEFEPGTVVVIDPSYAPRTGDFAVADVNGQPALGRIELRHSLWLVNGHGEHEIERVHGVVIQRAGRRRQHRKRYR